MTDFLMPILVLITAVLCVIDKKSVSERNRVFRKWKISSFLILIAVIIAIVDIAKKVEDKKDSNELKGNISQVKEDVTEIKSTIYQDIKDLEGAAISLDSLKLKLISMENKTLKAIEERQESIDEYNRMSDQLKKRLQIEEKVLLGKAPKVDVLTTDIVWEPMDTNLYRHLICFKNFGDRIATNVKYKVFALFVDSLGILTHQISSSIDDQEQLILYPMKETQTFRNHRSLVIDKKQFKRLQFSAVRILMQWKDPLMNKQYNMQKTFMWDGYARSQLKYSGANDLIYKLVDAYLLKNGINFSVDNQSLTNQSSVLNSLNKK